MGFFDKIKEGLAKTRAKFTDTLNEVFSNAGEIDEDFYDELEETLILADLGMDTVTKVMKELRPKNVTFGLTAEEVRSRLKQILKDMLDQSYALVLGGLSKKKQKDILGE